MFKTVSSFQEFQRALRQIARHSLRLGADAALGPSIWPLTHHGSSSLDMAAVTAVFRAWRTAVLSLNVNGRTYDVDAPEDMPLLWVIRELIGLRGTKFGCGIAQCGACTVHVDGRPVRSCVMPASSVENREITTIEKVGETKSGRRVQEAWLELEVVQCGYCQSGQIMSATALLNKIPAPSDTDIDAAMAGNICRCATYSRIRDAIKKAASV